MKKIILVAALIFTSACATGPSPQSIEMTAREKGRIGGGNLYELGNNEYKLEIGVAYANTPKSIELSKNVTASYFCSERFKKGHKITKFSEDYTKVFVENSLRDAGFTRVFFECQGKPSNAHNDYTVKIQEPVRYSRDEEAPGFKQVSIYPKEDTQTNTH